MKYRVSKIISESMIEVEPVWLWAHTFGSNVIDYHALLFGRPTFHSVGDEVELILPQRITAGAIVCIPFNKKL